MTYKGWVTVRVSNAHFPISRKLLQACFRSRCCQFPVSWSVYNRCWNKNIWNRSYRLLGTMSKGHGLSEFDAWWHFRLFPVFREALQRCLILYLHSLQLSYREHCTIGKAFRLSSCCDPKVERHSHICDHDCCMEKELKVHAPSSEMTQSIKSWYGLNSGRPYWKSSYIHEHQWDDLVISIYVHVTLFRSHRDPDSWHLISIIMTHWTLCTLDP